MELHFYPGQKKIIIKEKGIITGRYDAWGGPAGGGNDPHMNEIPTTSGIYIIHSVQPYRTSTWPMSAIKWGTKLKDMPSKKDIWYQLRSGKWGSVKAKVGASRDYIIQTYYDLYKKRMVPKTWVFNDFGPLAIRYFTDLNGNLKLDEDKGEKLSGEMIHTTPENEAQYKNGTKVVLSPSHGCIHIKPQDRIVLQSKGAFKKGTVFTVHKYSEII